jgi:hypothetical protein
MWKRHIIAVTAETEEGIVAERYCYNLLTGAVPEA